MKKIFIVLVLTLSMPAFSQRTSQPIDWKTLFQQIFYWNVWKNAERSSDGKVINWANITDKAIYYTPMNPNEAYFQMRNATSTQETLPSGEVIKISAAENANITRDKIFLFQNNWQGLQSGQKFENIQGASGLYDTAASDLLSLISNERWVKNEPAINYFNTKVGQAVLETLKDTVMVIIPGFGSHTIPDYTYPEIVEWANTYYGRPLKREATKDPNTGESVYVGENSPQEFYKAREGAPEMKFDIVHPLGYELGNSMTKDIYTAEDLKNWIEALPERYRGKKLILVGYSKGAPIAQNCVTMFESIRNRTNLILTLAGANQGSIAAQGGIDTLLKVTRSETPEEAVAKLEGQQTALMYFIRNMSIVLTPMLTPEQYNYFDTKGGGSSIFALFGLVGNVADTKNFVQAIDGVRDLTNFERSKWNLLNLNDSKFKTPLTIMNLSVITNSRDFFYPEKVNGKRVPPPQVSPQFLGKGEVLFGRDAAFLHFTSIMGFMEAPAGLFDTQVAWMDSKGMPLDQRNLGESLTDDRLEVLGKQLKEATGVDLPANWQTMSRAELLRTYNGLRNLTMNNLNFIDLGEVRGNHWDISFRQVYKPDAGAAYEHKFPRKASMSALVEIAAVWAKSKESAAKKVDPVVGGQP